MTAYFQNYLLTTPGALSAWSQVPTPTEEAYLAVSKNSAETVEILHKNGSLMSTENEFKTIQNSSKCTFLSWSNHSHILSIGCQNGLLIIYNLTTDHTFKNNNIHKNEITLIKWSDTSHKFASIDKNIKVIFKFF